MAIMDCSLGGTVERGSMERGDCGAGGGVADGDVSSWFTWRNEEERRRPREPRVNADLRLVERARCLPVDVGGGRGKTWTYGHDWLGVSCFFLIPRMSNKPCQQNTVSFRASAHQFDGLRQPCSGVRGSQPEPVIELISTDVRRKRRLSTIFMSHLAVASHSSVQANVMFLRIIWHSMKYMGLRGACMS